MRDYLIKTAEEAQEMLNVPLSIQDRKYADDSFRNRLNYLYKPLAFGAGGAALAGLAIASDASARRTIRPEPALKPALMTMGVLGGISALGGLAHSAFTHKKEKEKAKTYYKDTPVEHIVDGTAETYRAKIRPFLKEMDKEYFTRLTSQLEDPYLAHRNIDRTAKSEAHGSPEAAQAIASNLVDNYASARNYMEKYKLDPYDIVAAELLDNYRDKSPAERYAEYLTLKNNPDRYRRYDDAVYAEHKAEMAEQELRDYRKAYLASLHRR